MKFVVILSAAILLLSSCHKHRHNNTSISINESGSIFQMSASFNPSKTNKLQHVINNRLSESTDISFVNTEMDATLTLDDETKFYVRSYPGYLKIKFNKNQNSVESYERIKGLCEGIKVAVQ